MTSADLEWIAQGDQDERFADDPIRPVHNDILIARLRPGQEIELEAWCEKGLGKTHAKWSPVCTASYRLLPEVRVRPDAGDAEDASPLASRRVPSAFEVESAPVLTGPARCSMSHECAPAHPRGLITPLPQDVFFSARGRRRTARRARRRAERRPAVLVLRRCSRQAGWEERVQLARLKDHFIFTVESTGALPPEVLFTEAVKVLMQKASNIALLLKDAVASHSSGAV